ncbi:MAG: peptide chain release factor N(5)-glutamine methyltransferase [Myxococcota bacterium]|nr:peptide chain release factor N(5)-glutamine methyltransferase [Myxococcota bacterium]
MTQETWTIARVLNWTRGYFEQLGIPSPRLDAELILSHALLVGRMQLYLEHHKPLTTQEREQIRACVKRRARGEPIAYITGKKGFWDIELNVDERVLVPRPETEGIIERALELYAADQSIRFIDVGCGSGCIGLALAKALPKAHGVGIDMSDAALEVARLNAQQLSLDNINFHHGDLLDGLDDIVHLIVSNPPYIPSGVIPTLMKDVKNFEPWLALDGGADGLTAYRSLIPQSLDRLLPGGHLILEIGHDQRMAVEALLAETNGFDLIQHFTDLSGKDRICLARKKPEDNESVEAD